MPFVWLGEDPRYDMARLFEAVSTVSLSVACDRILDRFGREYGLLGFEIDSDLNCDKLSVWTEARAEAIAIYITYVEPNFDPKNGSNRDITVNPTCFRIALYMNTKAVDWKQERTVREALSQAFECPLVPLPRQYFE